MLWSATATASPQRAVDFRKDLSSVDGLCSAAGDRGPAGLDFADALHAATSAGTSRFVTFDSRLAKRAARALPRSPVVLAQ